MFGSTNPFGQSSSSPFGSSVFGQTSSNTTDPFAQKPFGSSNPFGSPTESSMFGSGMSTGVFGQTIGASSSPAFGSSTPAFGASSTAAFGSSSSAFGGSSTFGQKPAFGVGGFGSTPSQSGPFSSTFQQTQPSFGSNLFGYTSTFGAQTQLAFGATSTPAFGATLAPAFGATTTPAFGSSTSPIFGGTGTGFGASSIPAFGLSVTPAFGTPSTSLFGASTTSAFGASSTPAFGSSTAAFAAPSTTSFGFGLSHAFGQSASTVGSTPSGTTTSPFAAQISSFGAQATTPTFGSPGFGQSTFGAQQGGSRVVASSPTPEVDDGSGTTPGKLESISAMHAYKDKSHEELRWEDYQRGDKGGPNPAGQPASGISFPAPTQASPFGSTGAFGLAPFNTSSSGPFASATTTPSLFGGTSASGFGSSSTPSIFGGTTTPATFYEVNTLWGFEVERVMPKEEPEDITTQPSDMPAELLEPIQTSPAEELAGIEGVGRLVSPATISIEKASSSFPSSSVAVQGQSSIEERLPPSPADDDVPIHASADQISLLAIMQPASPSNYDRALTLVKYSLSKLFSADHPLPSPRLFALQANMLIGILAGEGIPADIWITFAKPLLGKLCAFHATPAPSNDSVIKEHEARIRSLNTRISSDLKIVSENQAIVEGFGKSLKEEEESRSKLQNELEELRRRVIVLEAQVMGATSRCEHLSNQVKAAQDEKKMKERDIEEAQKEISTIQQQMLELRNEELTAAAKMKEMEAGIRELSEKCPPFGL